MADDSPFAPLRRGDAVSPPHLARIVGGLKACTLPKPEWTHQAHLVFATGILAEVGLRRAEAETPDHIRRYNESVGEVNSDTEGYHHTLTLFFLRHVDAAMIATAGRPVHERATAILASDLSDAAYPLRFYSRDALFSVGARRGWRAPDLIPDPLSTREAAWAI